MATALKTKTALPAVKVSTGLLIDQLWGLREQKKEAESVVKDVVAKIDAQEELVGERLKEEGLDKASGKKATASYGKLITHAKVEDWDAFWAFIFKTKNSQLLQRRVSDAAYEEVLGILNKKTKPGSAEVPVPGVVPYRERRLSIRTLADQS